MARSILLAPLLLLAACDASLATWEGTGAFPVRTAFLTVCSDDLGASHALAVATSGRNCKGYTNLYDEPAAEPCDAWKELVAGACDPTAEVTSSATDALTFWLADLPSDAGLVGASASSAEHFRCQEQQGDTWTGDAEALAGTVSVADVTDDVAEVDVALGDLSGTIDFTVCR